MKYFRTGLIQWFSLSSILLLSSLTGAAGQEEVSSVREQCRRSPPPGVLFSSDDFLQPSDEGVGDGVGVLVLKTFLQSSDCLYQMEARPGRRVQLTFFLINTAGSTSNCYYGQLEIFQPGNTSPLHRYCGRNLNNIHVVSEAENLSFNFTLESSRWVKNRGFLAVWKEVEDDRESSESDRYLLSHPATFIQETPERLCVKLFQERDAGATVTARMFLERSKNPNPDNWMFRNSHEAVVDMAIKLEENEMERCFELTVPETGRETDSKGLLELELKTEDGRLDITTFKEVTIIRPETYSLIQTDKGQYKAGDKVRFRVLLLDHRLRPSQQLKSIEEVWVEDPHNRRIAQWKDQELRLGLMQEEFSLSEEPLLGQYKISFRAASLREAAQFAVSEYVLPKFEVKIVPPAAVVVDQETEFKVCAKYTHGGNVKGTAEALFSWEYYDYKTYSQVRRNISVAPIGRDESGCIVLVLTREDLREVTENNDDLELQVTFVEEGTGTLAESHWSGRVVKEPFKMEVKGPETAMIGLPVTVEVLVSAHDGSPLVDEPVNVCVSLFKDLDQVRKVLSGWWSMDEEQIVETGQKMVDLQQSKNCRTVLAHSGRIVLTVPLERNRIVAEVKKLTVRVTALNHQNKVSRTEQPSSKLDISLVTPDLPFSLYLEDKPKHPLACGEIFRPRILFSSSETEEFDLHYSVFSKGSIVTSGQKKVTGNKEDVTESLYQAPDSILLHPVEQTETIFPERKEMIYSEELEVEIDQRVWPEMKVVVLVQVRNTTLEQSRTFKVSNCPAHLVRSSWSESTVSPGTPVTLTVSSVAGSVCGVSAVDKSVEVLGNGNTVSQEKVAELASRLAERKVSGRLQEDDWYIEQNCPQAHQFLQVYQSSGLEVRTDLRRVASCEILTDDLLKKELSDSSYGEVAYSVSLQESLPQASPLADTLRRKSRPGLEAAQKVELRTFFPETWLFELQRSEDPSGNISLALTAPDTLTSWTGEAFCVSQELGLGIAEPASLLVSQDFFSELRLPYSVKRGETFPLNISVFNYLTTELPLTITLTVSPEEIEAELTSVPVCVPPLSNEIVSLDATGLALGELNITVETRITNGVENCSKVEVGEGFTDMLRRPVRVKAEGVPVEIVETEFKCVESITDDSKFDFKPLSLPDPVVPESSRAWVTLTGDVMAPALSNVGRLVQLPTGCGEQNMAGLVPNIYLLQYLTALEKEMPEVEEKAVEYMMVGYNRQQKYRHPAGSYSIWGGSDQRKGSTWLTAFVVKSFSDAAEFIDVDPDLVNESIGWLLEYQAPDGCFQKRGYVHDSYIKGGGTDDSLTAFVLTALLHAHRSKLEVEVPRDKMRAARSCMMKRLDRSDLYSSILASHAFVLYTQTLGPERGEEVEVVEEVERRLVSQLTARANTTGGDTFWQVQREEVRCDRCWWSYRPSSEAVEMTAYMVMTYVLREDLPSAVAAVKWLGRQRNSQGGFVSTQDTVVALQALSLYSQRVSRVVQDLQITLENQSEEKLLTAGIDETNSLLLREEKVEQELPLNLSVSTTGTGCVLVQTVLRYNTPTVMDTEGFSLTVNTATKPWLEVCSAYTGPRQNTGMVLMEVQLVTGWEAVNPQTLLNEVEFGVQRVEEEEKENKLVLYFDEITKREMCVKIEVKRVTNIKNSKDATVTVYDYYNREETATVLYNM